MKIDRIIKSWVSGKTKLTQELNQPMPLSDSTILCLHWLGYFSRCFLRYIDIKRVGVRWGIERFPALPTSTNHYSDVSLLKE